MVVDERSRHELYRRLEEVLGAEAATTLIEHLPPVGWSDVATKQDLAGMEERIDLRFKGMDERIDLRFTGLDERIDLRFTGLEERIDLRFQLVDERFNGVGGRFDDLEKRLDVRFEALENGLRASFEHELRTLMTPLIFGIVSVVLTMAALAFAMVRFT